MAFTSRSLLLAPLGVALVLAGCEGATGPDGGNTRIVLSQGSASGASFSVGAEGGLDADRRGGERGAVLALVDSLNFTITAVQALPAQYVDVRNDDALWETLTLPAPVTVDLLSLPTDEAGLEIARGDLPPGAYVRVRFLVSEADLRLRAPLTFEGHTFPAGEAIPLRLPNAWVRVPGAFFTVSEEADAVVDVEFDPATSLGQLVVTDDGRLVLTPVMRGSQWRHDWDDDDWDDDDRDDDYGDRREDY